MPTYEYACKSCAEHVEVVQSFADDPLTVCPDCGGPLRKVFGNIGISFKGSGFYKTDNRQGANGSSRSSSGTPANHAGSASDSSPSSDGGSSGSGSGDKGGESASPAAPAAAS